MYDVILVGNYSVDLVFTGMSEFPQMGKDTLSTGFMMTPGEAYISAVSMHRLGIKVAWAADFGDDEFSQFSLRRIREEGLDDSFFKIHPRPLRRISASASYPDDRAFLTFYDPDPPVPTGLSAILTTKATLVFVPGLYYGGYFELGLGAIHRKKMLMVMDGNSSCGDIFHNTSESRAIRKSISKSDIFLPNASEARRLTGMDDLETAIQSLGRLCKIVVVKDGANGSYAFINDQLIHCPSIKVDVVDTTGAGDNFNSGFLRGWLNGEAIKTCLAWGNIAGAFSTTMPGGTTRKITPADIYQAYASNYQ